MGKIDFSNVTEQAEGGSFAQLPAGNYICKITDMVENTEKQYVRMFIDIAEGGFTDYFDTAYFATRPYGHSVVLSYKSTALGMLKGRLHVISDCNPGFNAEDAFGDRDPFIDKRVGVQFNEEEFRGNDGDIRTNTKPGRLFRIDDLKTGKVPNASYKTLSGDWMSLEEGRKLKEAREREAQTPVFEIDVTDVELPF